MPITLDPQKQFVTISLMYVEVNSKDSPTQFIFINSKDDLDEWKSKGYRYENEVKEFGQAQKSPKEPIPGMPVEDGEEFDPTKIIYSIRTKWKRMTWKDQNTIFSKCLKTVPGPDGAVRTDLDHITYRDMKLKLCLKEWDLQDEHARQVPVSNETIDMLTPDVAAELINAFERYTEASPTDLGESKG